MSASYVFRCGIGFVIARLHRFIVDLWSECTMAWGLWLRHASMVSAWDADGYSFALRRNGTIGVVVHRLRWFGYMRG